MTTAISTEAAEAAVREAYLQGRQDEADACSRRHLVRVADILDAIDHHAGDTEQLRSHILTALRHDAP
jgi:hypothetical protein